MSQETTSGSLKKGKVVNVIPLKTAQRWAKRWSKREGDYNKHHHLNAFLIPKIDLVEVLKEGVDAVRAYIGVDDDGVEKLMIVGTKYDPLTQIYVDMITQDNGDAGATEDDIYDFTSPCPSTCDPETLMLQ
ncbi:hypothetical protein EKL99_03350 [Flavobacterium sp. ZB4P23]|uniref:hypothetical protein n=1 Tax=unclassified Flavobacterium TaxID=196869 RepID=UPI000F8376D7|nr:MULTISPECIES: hypothetical protein [unclassified Flavobacterium]RTY65273.1 hypothetical protein EKL95_13160 [Flavobacterium sp. LB2P53]RTY74143.1 hypothetical protein EKL96_08725 [Flavobacterium sp. LS1R10]RTY83634.1 hypothetical protein EKL99_03350 [Flavobacterium sp. ZB4P23]